MADTTIDLLKNSSYVGKMDELIAAVKSGGGTASDVEWDNVKNKPTTIGGYGITDAKIDNGTITLGNQTITPLTSAPVTSVNSKTGAVTLSAADVSAIPSTLTGTAGQVLTKTSDGQEWKDVDIPTALPNPNALTFTGAATGSYDGSAPLSVEIPSGGGGGGAWHTIGTQMMDGVEAAVSFDLAGETIIQIIVTAGWGTDLTATKATVSLTLANGATVEFTQQTMNGTSFSPKNIFTIFGNSINCRQMIFSKAEGARYSSAQGSFGVAYGYNKNAEYMVADAIATGITITFDIAPSNAAIVKVEGM